MARGDSEPRSGSISRRLASAVRTLRRGLPATVRRSYAAKFALVLVAVTVTIGAIGGATYVHTESVLQEDTQRELVSSAEIQAHNLDLWMNRTRLQMEAISESATFQDGNYSETTLYLWEVVERDQNIDAAYYIDTTNETVITGTGSTNTITADSVTTLYGRRTFTSVAARSSGTVVVSDPIRPDEESAPVVLFATTIPGRENRAVILVAELSTVSAVHLNHASEGEFVVVDADGRVVLAEDRDVLLSMDHLSGTRLEGTRGFLTATDLEGGQTAVGYADLASTDWTVTQRVPTRRAYVLRSDILTRILGIVFAVFLGAAVLAGTVGRGTIREVRTLSETARAIRDGDLNVEIGTDREDEFGDLFEAFDLMRRSLQRQIATAEEARREAEAAGREALAAKAETEAFSRHLEATAATYGDVMRACAEGDLDERIDPDDRSDAMASIAVSFNEMMDDVQEQNERLETVAGVLSHDVRNPLNVAAGRADLLAEEVDSTHVDPICDALDRIDVIVDDALVLALGSEVQERTPLRLSERARYAWEHVDTGAATLELDGDLRFAADPNLLEHVFENLFRNSIEHGSAHNQSHPDDASERAGDVAHIRVEALVNGFAVADDGPGIPPDRREKVLEPGFTTNRGGGGTGFGLAIVSRVVEAHGWRLSIGESADGGARFEIRGVDRLGE